MEFYVAMGTTDSIKYALCHEKAPALPPNPTSLQSLVVPCEWKTAGGTDPEQFLIHESGSDTVEQMFVFAP